MHFSLKIRHLVAKILMILVKGQLTEKLVVYIVKTVFTVGLMEVSLLSPGNINICCVAIAALRCHPEYWWGYVPGIPGGVDAYDLILFGPVSPCLHA